MASLPDYIKYVATYNILVCTMDTCGIVILPPYIRRHLQGSHHKLLKDQINEVLEHIDTIPNLIQSQDDIKLPQYAIPAVPYLPLYIDGLRCDAQPNECQYI